MRTLLVLAIHLVTSIAKLLGPGGARGLVAETLLVKHQLLVINRSRRRAPNLTGCDRIVMGLCSLFMTPETRDIILRCQHHMGDAIPSPDQ